MSKMIKTQISNARIDETNYGQVILECKILEKDMGDLLFRSKIGALCVYKPQLILDDNMLYQACLDVLDEVEKNMGDFLTDENKLKRELAKRITK